MSGNEGAAPSGTSAAEASLPALAASRGRFIPRGEIATLDGETFYRIQDVDALPPFLMNIPTDTDLWMFISSTGGLTAGRRDPDGALFPYETVDKLHDSPHHTGPVTLIRVHRPDRAPLMWEPLAPRSATDETKSRSLSKNALGNQLVFEEIHHEAALVFRYRWAGSDATGWVRTATLTNRGAEAVTLSLLDGVRNILPSGVPLALYQHSSCLVDAYKRADIDPGTRLGMFSVTARISDRPEPAEELRASTAWCHGLPDFEVAVAPEALERFRLGHSVRGGHLLTGRRGNYFVTSTLTLDPGASMTWHIGVDSGRSHIEVERLRARLLVSEDIDRWVSDSLREASERLRRIVASADGMQLTERPEDSIHHFANVLFNNLRGGVFVSNYAFPRADLIAFVGARNHRVAARHTATLEGLAAFPTVMDLNRAAEVSGDPDLRRLCFEYLPLCFGRRHGDPSRPWNRFSILVRNPDGSQALRYEGNWRDVFQNWEALTVSFPEFTPSIIAKFLNASTVDGFNPYRIARDGVDWEVYDPTHPWSGIGYWGDHQIVYLLKFLESMRHHVPGDLEAMLEQEIFSYADVPYRLKPYAEMLANPRATIVFDEAHDAAIQKRVAEIGSDGKLLSAADGGVYHASLLEKLIVPALSKLSCMVPDGGIWMNTERPEWNDANNALVGNGLSVVTLGYFRRYLVFLEELLVSASTTGASVSAEVAAWLRGTTGILGRHLPALAAERMDDHTRKQVMDDLGNAFSSYRQQVYAHGFSRKIELGVDEVLAWIRGTRAYVDHAIRANRREDGLYHSYNLLEISADGTRASVRRLGMMLEGQVSALSSGLVGAAEATAILSRLYASPLYRADQNSFLLYPVTTLPAFLERNQIPQAKALAVPIVGELLAAGDTSIIERDAASVLRFHGDFSNVRDVAVALDRLERLDPWSRSVARDRDALIALFEDVFGHRTFTGRSGTMYAYEGLGSVYWHMVAKLMLAVQEVARAAYDAGEDPAVGEALARDYYRIRGGLGFEKSVRDYGAFPTDPYSHTPTHAGAQQPGMTGQVKEEILTRFGELGLRVREGVVGFDPVLLRRNEFLTEAGIYHYFGLDGTPRSLTVPARALAFSYCQVPIVYSLSPGPATIRITRDTGVQDEIQGCWMTPSDSRALNARSGGITRIDVSIPERTLFED